MGTFDGYTPKRPLREYQKHAVNQLWRQHYGGALFMQPRTGKTKTIIEYINVLSHVHLVQRVLIIAPRITFTVWKKELEQDCVPLYKLDVWDAASRSSGVLPKADPNILHVVLTNYEAFSVKTESGSTGRIKNRKLCEKWLDTASGSLIVLDESHKIKNARTHMGKNIIKLGAHSDFRAICTGTPITKAERVKDVYNQFLFLNPSCLAPWGTVSDFEDYFTVNTITAGGWKSYDGLRNEHLLAELIASQAFRITREECMDLPPRTVTVLPVKLAPKTVTVYNKLVTELIAPLDNPMSPDERAYIEAKLPIVLNLRLTQITGGFVGTKNDSHQQKVTQVGSEKLDVLKELLTANAENGEKTVVCARFIPEIHGIFDVCVKHRIPVWGVWGEKTQAERDTAIVEFTKSDSGVMIIQPQAGGVGIDLSTAPNLVWYSLPNSFVDFTQASDRVALNPTGVNIFYLIATGTIDEKSLESLRNSHEASHGILDNPRGLLINKL